MPLAEKFTHFTVDLLRRRSGLKRKEITIAGELRYAYLEGGQGEPLLLLHGFWANKDNFTRVAHFLTLHYRQSFPILSGSANCHIRKTLTMRRRSKRFGPRPSCRPLEVHVFISAAVRWAGKSH